MNTKLENAKKFVHNHSHALAFAAGAIVVASSVAFNIKGRTLLELPADQAAKLIKDGGAVIYATSLGDFTLRAIPIHE